MTIMTHLKITFTTTLFSGLIYWNLLNFSCKCEDISSFEVVPENFLLTLGKTWLLENHLPTDDKLTLNQSSSGLCIGVQILTQRHKVLGCLSNVFSVFAKNVLTFSSISLFCFYVLHSKKLYVTFYENFQH